MLAKIAISKITISQSMYDPFKKVGTRITVVEGLHLGLLCPCYSAEVRHVPILVTPEVLPVLRAIFLNAQAVSL